MVLKNVVIIVEKNLEIITPSLSPFFMSACKTLLKINKLRALVGASLASYLLLSRRRRKNKLKNKRRGIFQRRTPFSFLASSN
jgi:hypothetical protein